MNKELDFSKENKKVLSIDIFVANDEHESARQLTAHDNPLGLYRQPVMTLSLL